MAVMTMVGFAAAGSSVLNAFYNDVVPPDLMGRFVGGMRFLGSVGALIFQLFVMQFFDANPVVVFIVITTVGFVGEMLMLFNVKEGNYPPPPPKESVFNVVKGFVKEGFANRYIIFLWLTMGVTAFGGPVMGTYFNLYFTDANTGLGLSTARLGQLLAMGTGIGLALIIPCGWFVDRFGPKRLWCLSGLGVGLVQLLMFFVAKDIRSISILYAVFAMINTVMTAALLPLMYCFIPKDKFGQLSGSNVIVTSILQIVAVNALGWLITLSNNQYGALHLRRNRLYAGSVIYVAYAPTAVSLR
jgi:MFS family permease